MDPRTLRADIPALDDGTIYLNTGASGPAPRRVLAAGHAAERTHEIQNHRGNPYPPAWDAYDESRAAIADLLGTTSDTVALTNSTADGISRVAGALPWERGDVVVHTDLEHPAGKLPFARLAREGVEVRTVPAPGGRLDREAYADAVHGARLVCLSSLSWLHGTHLPVRDAVELAHDAGARVLVDAVQSVGHHPVDAKAWGADAVAAAGHKWLLGTWGAGFLRIAPEAIDAFEPRHLGYRAVPSGVETLDYHDTAARFEVGTQSLAPHGALREAIAIRQELGADTVTDHIDQLATRLIEGLCDRTVSPRPPESGLVAFTDPTPEATVERLAEADIHVRTVPGSDGDLIRASVHIFNTAEDVDALLTAL